MISETEKIAQLSGLLTLEMTHSNDLAKGSRSTKREPTDFDPSVGSLFVLIE